MHVQTPRLVIKLGTGLLTRTRGTSLDTGQFRRLAAEIAGLVARGHQCIVVTSGAVAAGMIALGLKERSGDTPTIQACAAIGQSRLMRVYETHFARHGLAVAQLLDDQRQRDLRVRAGTHPGCPPQGDELLRVEQAGVEKGGKTFIPLIFATKLLSASRLLADLHH